MIQKRLKFHISTTDSIDGEGMGKIESWKNKKVLISQAEYDRLDEDEKEGKYSSEKIESYFTLCESLLAPKSNPLLAVKELHFAKQGSMDSGKFHAHVVKIAKRCKFPCAKAEERAIRDTIFLGMNSTRARDKAINLINEEGKELTVEFLMQVRSRRLQCSPQESIPAIFHYISKFLLHMTVNRTRARAAKQNKVMERIRDRRSLYSRIILILVINLENPQGWWESA